MRCLRKFQWVKLFRDKLPDGKGILGFWAKLAACAAYRNGTSLYCGFENEVAAGTWVGGVVGVKSILGLNSRQQTIEILDKLVELGYIEYEIEQKTKKLTYRIIEQDEYESFRRHYDVKIAEIETRIIEIQAKIEEINTGISPENDFVRTFKEMGEISTLTRSLVIAFIENIYVYEDNRIEINLKYRDEYETIVDYLYNNKLIIYSLEQFKNAEIVRQMQLTRGAV